MMHLERPCMFGLAGWVVGRVGWRIDYSTIFGLHVLYKKYKK
jgi:hypothetical protein